ncbi:hypothetical protein RB195_019631 [Necator americanus]|uniref:Uncharacterized protein n=1 Tax=Necator americanus TaxID=51031 RepID=A0ABR1CHA1_NECAM
MRDTDSVSLVTNSLKKSPKMTYTKKKRLLYCWWDHWGMFHFEFHFAGFAVDAVLHTIQLEKLGDTTRHERTKRGNNCELQYNATPYKVDPPENCRIRTAI